MRKTAIGYTCWFQHPDGRLIEGRYRGRRRVDQTTAITRDATGIGEDVTTWTVPNQVRIHFNASAPKPAPPATTVPGVLEQNRAMCGFCQVLQHTNPGEWCIAHQDDVPPSSPAAGASGDEEPDTPPREMCREEPRRKSICHCFCTRDVDHTGRHYCGDCGWSWGRGQEPTAAEKQAAHA